MNYANIYLLCLLTEQSIFLGGDTAQTINKGNKFRFKDLLKLFENSIQEKFSLDLDIKNPELI